MRTQSQAAHPDSPAPLEDGSKKDKYFRRYASNVERALSLFDSALQEWADYIAFLSRLLKALQTRPLESNVIPHKATVSKRLAQCLDPALPSGVHQKTLEVYAYVFAVLDTDGLSKDLPLYLPGLSPTMAFASLSVKPSLLSLFETFIVPLSASRLRPALKAIILSLVPGLEEEASEEFERTLSLLNRFRSAVGKGESADGSISSISGDQYFWQSFFLSSITGSNRRQGAVSYLTRELPRLGIPSRTSPDSADQQELELKNQRTSPKVEAVTAPEPGLLIRCFATGLQDELLLVQRGFLDLLVTHLPLHSAVLRQKVVSQDLELLISAAASVVARREMSLNRRLWSWFLGPERNVSEGNAASPAGSPCPTGKLSTGTSETDYFERYGLGPLVAAILNMVSNDKPSSIERARPYRICLSLMDRWEVGGLVVPRVFLPAMESVWRYQTEAPSKEAFIEVLRSANVFFDGIEPSLIWAETTRILTESLCPENQAIGGATRSPEAGLDLVSFIITNFNVKEEEMLALHIPLALLSLLICVRLWERDLNLVRQAFKVANHLLNLIPQRILTTKSKEWSVIGEAAETLQSVLDFYQKLRSGSEDAHPPFETGKTKNAISSNVSYIILKYLKTSSSMQELGESILFLEKFVRKAQSVSVDDYEILISGLLQATTNPESNIELEVPFSSVATLISAADIIAATSEAWISDPRVRKILPSLLIMVSKVNFISHFLDCSLNAAALQQCDPYAATMKLILIEQLWRYTSPSNSRHAVEAVRYLWRIHSISPNAQLVESSVATFILQDEQGVTRQQATVEGARHFATVWAHSSLGDRRSSVGRASHGGNDISSKQNGTLVLARPLLLILDSLLDHDSELFLFTVGWLKNVSSMQRIVDFLVYRIRCSPYFNQEKVDGLLIEHAEAGPRMINVSETIYYLKTLTNLINHSKTNIWPALAHAVILSDAQNASNPKYPETDAPQMTTEAYLVEGCLATLNAREQMQQHAQFAELRQTSVRLLQQIANGQSAAVLEMTLVDPLLDTLFWAVQSSDLMLQMPLMDLILTVMKTPSTKLGTSTTSYQRKASRETTRGASPLSVSSARSSNEIASPINAVPWPALLECIVLGISSSNNQPIVEHWIRFLEQCLPFFANNAFHTFMPLVDCFIKAIETVFEGLRYMFAGSSSELFATSEPITILNALLNGLEQVLAQGHDQLLQDEGLTPTIKTPEQPQGFFGNMVSGVFAPEAQKARSTTANNRLTVLLCFKDAVRACFKMWSWGDCGSERLQVDPNMSASFYYTSLRLRNRTRRMLEHLFAAEALECLETLVEVWQKAGSADATAQLPAVFNLLHALEATRPKNTIPALFNAIYSRTNPNVLDPVRKSSLTSELSDIKLATFLAAYTKSMEDDALDEIWVDCMTFLRDVLGNPMPQRHNLPNLLMFTANLGEKIDKTNFGEQRKMRRDIGEIFYRLLAATFTTKPLAFSQDTSTEMSEKSIVNGFSDEPQKYENPDADDVVSIVASILPGMTRTLVETDRMTGVTITISAQILMPTFRWKSFPRNVTASVLDILNTMSRIAEASKSWRKDAAEAFNDARFFLVSDFGLVRTGWMPALRQWVLQDKDRMPELLSRISPPTTAGIMFGVGANSARLEADRKTQLNLRRMALLLLSADEDTFVINLHGLQEKLVDLMTATAASSPSSATRAEVYMVLRALILKTSAIHLSSFWPIINTELYDALSSLNPTSVNETYSVPGVLQAAKLLDTLLTTAPDEFQLREWLFITDTIDAVYRPHDWKPVALVDELVEGLDSKAETPQTASIAPFSSTQQGRKPLLSWQSIRAVPKESIVDRLLRPFLRQLSINAFESTYRMEEADRQACSDDLLHELFDDSTIV